jgi:hypothetical protein
VYESRRCRLQTHIRHRRRLIGVQMIRIHPLKTRLPPAALGALPFCLDLDILTAYRRRAAPNLLRFQQILRVVQRLAPPHTWTRTWLGPAPPQNFHSSRGFLLPVPGICQQMCPATDRCQRNLQPETALLPAARNQPVPATGECFPVQPFHPRADVGHERRLARSATQQWCGSRSCSRRSQATPKRPSTQR